MTRKRVLKYGFMWAVPVLVLLLAGVIGLDPIGRTAATAADASTVRAAAPYAGEIAPRIRGAIAQPREGDARASAVSLPALRGSEEAVLTYAPEVPPAIKRKHASRVKVDMEVVEVVKELADGVQYTFWTFGGEVPGPMIRVREGDLVEFTLMNHPDNKLPHNIDLHAVTGTGGGAEATLIVPGKQATFDFRALRPGLYVYHCATAPVGLHVANGMYGLIYVQPENDLPEVDREYYVMQSEFYTAGAFGEAGLQEFDMERAIREDPSYVVFNGGVGALTGTGALRASVGERVRLFVGNGGPNLSSSFHVIGEIFDNVYTEGGTRANQHDVQTTAIPPGGAAMVDFELDVPGTYTLVDHAIFRAFNKGAVGIMEVTGEKNPQIYSGQKKLSDYDPAAEGGLAHGER